MVESRNSTRWLASRARSFSPSLIGQLSQLALECGAINLAEGIPDYATPSNLKIAATKAIQDDVNQYRYSQELCSAIAGNFSEASGLHVDPKSQVALCCGQSGAISSALLAVVEPGDEVLLLDPAYETYGACVTLAGGIPVYVQLQPPDWTVRKKYLKKYVGPQTKAIVINSPNNPTGRVLTCEELTAVAQVCEEHDLLAITDEVYERLVFDESKHVSLASLPGMADRTIVTSSLSKTYGVTGWRIGWAIAPEPLCTAIAKIHCKLNDSPPAPFQEAAIVALNSPYSYYIKIKTDFEGKRDAAVQLLVDAGLQVPFLPQGGMFVWARIPPAYNGTDVEYVMDLIRVAGVALVPGANFFHTISSTNTSSSRENIAPVAGSLETSGFPKDGALPSCDNGDSHEALPQDGREANKASESGRIFPINRGSGNGTGYGNANGDERLVNANVEERAEYMDRYVRVAFCKEMSTLQAASTALKKHKLV